MHERRNDPEIMKGRAIACTIQLGSISSLRCQKSRIRRPVREHACEVMFSRTMSLAVSQSTSISPSSLYRAPPGTLRFALRGCATRSRRRSVVGLGRLELPTSRLSSARSNQLSYKPLTLSFKKERGHWLAQQTGAKAPDAIAQALSPWRVFVREERETKTAKSRQWSSTILKLLAP